MTYLSKQISQAVLDTLDAKEEAHKWQLMIIKTLIRDALFNITGQIAYMEPQYAGTSLEEAIKLLEDANELISKEIKERRRNGKA